MFSIDFFKATLDFKKLPFKFIFITFIISFCFLIQNIFAQIMSRNVIKALSECVVTIYQERQIGKSEKRLFFIGTGWLFEPDSSIAIQLVTARHIADNKNIFVRYNLEGKIYPIYQSIQDWLDLGLKWKFPPDSSIDLAFISVPMPIREKLLHTRVLREKIKLFKDLYEGQEVLILGFPMGFGSERNIYHPIFRTGIISYIDKENQTFLVDAQIFPGNSGGIVIAKAQPYTFTEKGFDTSQMTQAYAIGTVSSYISYVEEAESKQTGRTRIIFEENSGLVNVYPIDLILDYLGIK